MFDASNPDHLYDVIQKRNCSYARHRYEVTSKETRAKQPAAWNLINGLISVCFAVQGEKGEWAKAIDAYKAVKGKSTGDCKYEAAYHVLEQIASFLMANPRGNVLIREAPTGTGAVACPYRITQVRVYDPSGVQREPVEARPGDTVSVQGTWPSEARRALLNETAATVIPFEEQEDKGCCHNAFTNFLVPDGMQPGKARIKLFGEAFELTAPFELTIKR